MVIDEWHRFADGEIWHIPTVTYDTWKGQVAPGQPLTMDTMQKAWDSMPRGKPPTEAWRHFPGTK